MTAIARRVGIRLLQSIHHRETATLVQATAGSRNEHGRWVPGTPAETSIFVVSAPISGQERLSLEEGIRDRNIRKFWMREELEASESGSSGHSGDGLVYNGKTWQVYQASHWQGYTEVIAVAAEIERA